MARTGDHRPTTFGVFMRYILYFKFIRNILKYILTGYGMLQNRFFLYFTYKSRIYIRIDIQALYDMIGRCPDDNEVYNRYKELQVFQEFILKKVRREYEELSYRDIHELGLKVASDEQTLANHPRSQAEVNRINNKIYLARSTKKAKITHKVKNKRKRRKN